MVYLRDTAEDQGAFCCVPSLYRDVDQYLADHPEAGDSRRPEAREEDIVRVGGRAGSLIVWHRRMPHSSTLNHSTRPRWVQYVAMDKAGTEEQRTARIEMYEKGLPPEWAVVQNVPGQQIPEPNGPAELTPLGRRLVGYLEQEE